MKNCLTKMFLFSLLGVIAGCSDGDSGKTFEFPDFDINIQTEPETLQVGKDAAIRVSIIDSSDEHNAKSGCGVRFRQYMPGMRMDSDDIYMDMKESKKGIYQGRSGEFSMGGDWVIEFDIKCENETHTVPIPYHLEWPE